MKELEKILAALKTTFENHSNPEDTYADQLLPKIDKTIWATAPQQYLELLKVERARISKGKMLKAAPKEKHNCLKLLYDQYGRLIYEEKWGSHPSHGYKKYFIHDEEQTNAYTFNREGSLEEIEWQQRVNGVVTNYGNYAKLKAITIDRYLYDEKDRLVEIQSLWSYGHHVQHPTYYISYDNLENIGVIRRVDPPSESFPQGQDIEVYRRHAYSIKALTDILLEEYTLHLESSMKEEPDANLLLMISAQVFNADDWLPPKYQFFQHEQIINSSLEVKDGLPSSFFEQPLELKVPLAKRLREVSELLMQEIGLQEKYDLPLKLLQKLGKRAKDLLDSKNKDILVVALDMPDDYYEPITTVLNRIYTKKEQKDILQTP